jgi:hypothetical protein
MAIALVTGTSRGIGFATAVSHRLKHGRQRRLEGSSPEDGRQPNYSRAIWYLCSPPVTQPT